MSSQKPDGQKPAGQEEGESVQPINLAAPRMPAPPVTTFANLSTPMVNQPVTLRPTTDASKPSLMTLYFRSPANRPPGPGHIMSPVVGGHAQHFPKQAFKNLKGLKVGYYQQDSKLTDKSGSEVNIKVIRMPPTDISQQPGQSGIAPGILPTALGGATSRHIAPSALHQNIPTTASGAMASIIKGTAHGVSQVSHVIHQPYSSHVPRGPAAVASISAAPKSAVATPILRVPHSANTMTLSSSMARSPTLAAGRTATPPVSSSHTQVIDFQKSTVGHSLSCGPTQIGLVTRALEVPGSSLRAGFPHSPSIAIAKPISISSQPIVQHLQQVSEKGYLKNVSSVVTTTSSNLTPAHQTNAGVMSDVHNVCVVPTITRATISSISAPAAYATGIMQLPAGTSLPQHLPLRPSLIQPQMLHPSGTGLTAGQCPPHQTFTVINTKSLPSNNQSVALAAPMTRPVLSSATLVPSTAVVTCSSSIMTARSLGSQGTLCSTIPVAKVYPQQLPQVCIEQSSVENPRTTGYTTISSTTTPSTTASMTTTTTSLHQTIVISDKRPDSSTAMRFTSLSKPPVGAGGSNFAVPSHYVYDQYGGSLTVHPYVSTTNQNFTAALPGTQLRPLALSHSSVCIPANSSSSVQPINSLMVAVDSRHVSLHPQFGSIAVGKGNSEVTPATSTIVSTTATTLASMAQQQQGSNHLSPRPSILRKRAGEIVGSVAKRNLIPTLCSTEPQSPKPEMVSTSPKPSEPQKENGLHGSTINQDIATTAATIRKLNLLNEKLPVTEELGKEANLPEASPRKKPRKQLLAANELMETNICESEKPFEQPQDVKPNIEDIKIEDDSVKWVTFCKRQSMSLLGNYRHNWKTRNNHFLRYTDVRPKDEKKSSVNEIANQKNVMQEAHGWKVLHLTAQMEDLMEFEESVFSRLSKWVDLEEKSPFNEISNAEEIKMVSKFTDLVKGNLQRSKIAQEQATESRQQILKIIDHKTKILDLLSKNVNRRPLKKKEKS